MRTSRLRPLAQKLREFLEIVRHDDPAVAGCVREQFFVRQRRQLRVGTDRDDVVAAALQRTADATARHVRVEQRPHLFLSEIGADKGIEVAQCFERASGLDEPGLNVLRKPLGVRKREPHRLVGKRRMIRDQAA
jgi:hypothetical protein